MHAKPNRDTVPQVTNGRINGRFAPGFSGNPGGSPEATRRAFNKRFLLDLAEDWQQHGREVFKRVRRESPASYLKVCAMLVPREMKVEHSGGVKAMSDEEIEQAIEAIQAMLGQRAGEGAKVIEGTAETIALPAPDVVPDGPNKVMDAPDTAVGARKRKPRKGKTCAHLSTLSVSRPSGSSLVGGATARAGDQDRAGDGRGRQRGGAAMTIAARGATDA
jgi:hypothetical protein